MNASLLQILKHIPILNDIDEDDLAVIVKKVKLKRYPIDTYVFHEGDQGDVFYIIKSGKIEIVKKDENGNEKSMAILYPDNFFGEMALLSEKPRNASAKCLENTELFIFERKDFFDFLYL